MENTKYLIGVDVGGTAVKMGLLTSELEAIDYFDITTSTDDSGSHILPDIAAGIRENVDRLGHSMDDIAGVGMGIPGPVNDYGEVFGAVNLGWGTFNARLTLENLLGVPVKVANDANVAAMGEMLKGGGIGYKSIVMATLGTGVGGGIVINGQILSGAFGSSGEIGHMHIVDDEEDDVCSCGKPGCLERYVSANGLVRMANVMMAKSGKDSVLRKSAINAKIIWEAVRAGDILAVEVAEAFGKILGKGLAICANCIDPEMFIIGGGMSNAGPILLEYIEKYYKKFAFSGNLNAKFALAKLGNSAGVIGAAGMFR